MDFTKLDTKQPAERGAFLHLKHPALGHLLYSTDDPLGTWDGTGKEPEKVGVTVRGTESESVKEEARRLAKQRMMSPVAKARNKNNSPNHIPTADEIDAQTQESEEAAMAFVCSLVVSFEGLDDKDGKPLEATDANKRAFFKQSDDLVAQVIAFSQKSANFFGKG